MSATNPSVFPFPDTGQWVEGMTLHDWFAGQALAGILDYDNLGCENYREWAEKAYLLANAMIEVRYEISKIEKTEKSLL